MVRWTETYSPASSLNAHAAGHRRNFPQTVAGHPRAWIFTSATLAVNGDFAHYTGEMGLDGGAHRVLGQPLRLSRAGAAVRARRAARAQRRRAYRGGGGRGLAGDRGQPRPRFPAVHQPCARCAAPTNCCAERFEREGCDYPLLLQGEGTRSELLERFRRLGNAVLVASQSFWEGVDVRGEALSLVVIDKLPFAPPDDPVLAARIEHI